MVTISSIASRLKAENNWSDDDITDTIHEYHIDNAIDHINLVAGTSIADLSGTAASKSITATANELTVVKELSSLLGRAYLEQGPQVSTGPMTVTQVSTDPHFQLQMKLFDESLKYLRGRSFKRT